MDLRKIFAISIAAGVLFGVKNPLKAQIPADRIMKYFKKVLTSQASLNRGGWGPGEACVTAIPITEGIHYSDGPSSGGGCYYCNGAVNADWYVYTPSQSGFVWIKTCEEGADTRLWVYRSTSDCSHLELIAGFDDECIITPDPDAEYYATEAFFPVCAGLNYYLEWDDMWDGSPFFFSVLLIPFSGTEIMAAGGVASEYTSMPPTASGLRGYITALNVGENTLTGVKTKTEIIQGSAIVFTQTENVVPALAVCADPETYFSGPYPFSVPGNYTVKLSLAVNETETGAAPNSVENPLKVDTVFARDDGGPFYDLNISDPIEILGHNFVLSFPDQLTSLSFRLGPTMFANPIPAGMKTRLHVYAVNPANNRPTVPLDSTDDYFFGLEDTGWVTLPLKNGPLSLPSGPLFIGFRYFLSSPADLIWGATEGQYYPGRNLWVKVSGLADFLSLDSLVIGDNWSNGFALALRANFGDIPSAFVSPSEHESGMLLWPTPASSEVYISITAEIQVEEMILYDALGRCVSVSSGTQISGPPYAMSVSSVPAGIYHMLIKALRRDSGVPVLLKRKLVIVR